MQISVAEWVVRNAERHREKTAILYEQRAISYRELAERSRRMTGALEERGVEAGDRVALLMFNQPEVVEVLFACAWLRAIVVPLNWRLSLDELELIINDCEPKVLIGDGKEAERAAILGERCRSINHQVNTGLEARGYEAWLAGVDPTRIEDPRLGDGDDVLEIMYTAGSTGTPKGVMLTQANLFWHTINGFALGADPDARGLALLPLFHAGGLNGSVMPLLHVGATVLLHRKFEPKEVLAAIERHGVTGMLTVPTVYQMLSDLPEFESANLEGCRFLSGGAPLPESLIERFHGRGLELSQGYGLTETAPGATGMWPKDCFRKSGTVGRPCLYTDVRIVDQDDEPLPTGEIGEIVMRGPNIMKGYWNRPEATAEALRGGWFHSGDLGRFDEDGFLSIVGRMKEMIISGGENIFPAEIEKLLAAHPDVELAAVIGIPHAKWGEIPRAIIQPRALANVDAETLRAYCAERLAAYKVPKEFHFMEALPLTGAGKIAKALLQEQVDQIIPPESREGKRKAPTDKERLAH